MVELEDEADRGSPVVGAVDGIERSPVDLDRAGVGRVQRAEQVEERALAAPGRSGERDELARGQPQGRPVEGLDPAALEGLLDPVDDDRRPAHRGTTQ
jgi:hypothetical protein